MLFASAALESSPGPFHSLKESRHVDLLPFCLNLMFSIIAIIQSEQIKASLDNGVLTVNFPKSTPDQAPKKITIS